MLFRYNRFSRIRPCILPETTEIIQPALAPTKFYIPLSKVRACIFIFSGFSFVSVCRSDETSAPAFSTLTDISIRCLSHAFSHRDLFIFILHWSLVVKALLRDCTVDILMLGSNIYKYTRNYRHIGIDVSFNILINLRNTLFYYTNCNVKCET